ncbi:hypothetical protein SAMN03159489_04209 [Pseudomonas sp. NFPP07]|jgi:hypothetical protein|nr:MULTISPECIES: hypothetical protein [Pseudomonas]AZD16088.1 hypothetical protein C4K25_3159 [Pseudomonas chlororaphis]EJL05827.1 putative lipoprotein [Pseudomonas chlororaphis subsp. aureofaciens 30-84]MCP1478617.1 hypothetical protein [Pseudomonas chlororaphis]MCP1595031.1 hypothetical protein [Pseudomonas chlororaphis]ROL89360.1 hypothetical protein BK637_09060 [Pseudomonas chlororaphis]
MKRLATLTLTLCSTLLLGGCYPHWEDGRRYDRDHDGWRDHSRYDRDYYRDRDRDDDRYDRRYDRRDKDGRYRRDRDDDDDDD